MFNSFIKYTARNKFITGVTFYLFFSTVLKAATSIDICIPCVWKSIFDVDCPGCGLTTATINLMQFDIIGAFESNWLIFIVLPTVTYYVIQDYFKFMKENAVL